jgi:hypothetical protein
MNSHKNDVQITQESSIRNNLWESRGFGGQIIKESTKGLPKSLAILVAESGVYVPKVVG